MCQLPLDLILKGAALRSPFRNKETVLTGMSIKPAFQEQKLLIKAVNQ